MSHGVMIVRGKARMYYQGGTFWHCGVCGKRLRRAKAMRRHVWRVHFPF